METAYLHQKGLQGTRQLKAEINRMGGSIRVSGMDDRTTTLFIRRMDDMIDISEIEDTL